MVEVLKRGRRRENVRVGRDGSGLCKQQFGEVSQAMVIREALGGAQAHPNRALNRAFDEDDDGQFGSPAASLPPRSQPASHGPPPLSSEAEVRGEIESVSAVQFWSCACGTFW